MFSFYEMYNNLHLLQFTLIERLKIYLLQFKVSHPLRLIDIELFKKISNAYQTNYLSFLYFIYILQNLSVEKHYSMFLQVRPYINMFNCSTQTY